MTRLLLILSLLLAFNTSYAGHLVGGEISYYHIGGDTYEVSLIMYRDCYAKGANVAQKFDSAVNISIYNASNNELIQVVNFAQPHDSTRLPVVVEVPCLPNPPDICVLEMVYTDTVIIDVPPNGVYLVNQRCCRTPNALNILSPNQFGSTYSAYIPGSNLFNGNSSPRFNQVPPIALCAGIYLDLDYSATDPDSDSLYYDFCTPFHGGGSNLSSGVPQPDTPASPPFDTVMWMNGYHKGYQLPSAPAFEIDHNTGVISGRPDQLGTYVFGVCVSEYREGLRLGENRRDFQMEITPCDVEAAAAIDSAIEECIGLQIQFYNKSTLGEYFYWDFGDPNTNDDTSSKPNPSYTYPDTGFYTIRLVAVGAAGCSDTTYFTYHVRPKIIPEYQVPISQCFENHSFDFIHGGYAKTSTLKYWVIRSDTILIVPDLLGIYDQKFPNPGEHVVQLVYEDFGCVKVQSDTIRLYKKPIASILDSSFESCSPLIHTLSTETEFAEKRSYQWYINDSLFSTDESPLIYLSKPGLYDLSMIMTTDSLCIDTISLDFPEYLNVLQNPIGAFYSDPLVTDMFEPNFTLFNTSLDADNAVFYLDSLRFSSDSIVTLTLQDTGNYMVSLIVTNDNGCNDTVSEKLRVSPEFLVYISNSFTPNGDGFNDIWLPRIFVTKDYSLEIRDRWGSSILKTNDFRLGWNGSKNNNGKECPTGVYHYDISATDLDNKVHLYTGTITLYH